MKLLLSTYSCYPCKTSEPGNAWRAINEALRNQHEVWAVIEEEHQAGLIRKHLAEHPMPGFHPVYLGMPSLLVKTIRARGMLDAVYYHLWQEKLVRFARELHRHIRFDLVHHVTFGRYWSPCGVRTLGIPFIWGPVGAAETPPPSFVSELPPRYRLIEATRNGARNFFRHSRSLRDTVRAATIGIGVTHESCEALRRLGVRRVEQMPQMALTDEDLALFGRLPDPPPGPFRAICIGRHVHWKGFHLAIRAFARFAASDPEAELWLINDGPFRKELEKAAAQTGMAARVKFLGIMPTYNDVLQKLGQSHVLLHPALHEGFGNVCLEAMAAGRPVACLDIGGPASQITPETGCAAPATTPTEAVMVMAAFLEKINRDRPLLAAMSAKAREHVKRNFTMRQVNETMQSFYHQALAAPAQSGRDLSTRI